MTINKAQCETLRVAGIDLTTQCFSHGQLYEYVTQSRLEEIGINAANWIDSAQDRDYWRALVNAALNLRVQ